MGSRCKMWDFKQQDLIPFDPIANCRSRYQEKPTEVHLDNDSCDHPQKLCDMIDGWMRTTNTYYWTYHDMIGMIDMIDMCIVNKIQHAKIRKLCRKLVRNMRRYAECSVDVRIISWHWHFKQTWSLHGHYMVTTWSPGCVPCESGKACESLRDLPRSVDLKVSSRKAM